MGYAAPKFPSLVSVGGTGGGSGAHGIDKPPASPAAENDEFEGVTLDAKWTKTGDNTIPSDVLNQIDSYLVWDFVIGGSPSDAQITQPFAPADADFSVRAKVGLNPAINGHQMGFFVEDSGSANRFTMRYWKDFGAVEIGTYRFLSGSYAILDNVVIPSGQLFLQIQRISGVYSAFYSEDGLFWSKLATTPSMSFTVARLAIGAYNPGSEKLKVIIDWVRVNVGFL